jgi:uncharacterized protein YkwD
MKKPKILLLLAFLLLLTGAFAQKMKPRQLMDFDGFTNAQYAAWLAEDGWPVEQINTARNAQYLNDDEKNMILAMNLIRHDPVKYAQLYVQPRIELFDGKIYRFPGRIAIRTNEGAAAVKELHRELLKAKPAPLFYPSPGMSRAAKDHAQYMKRTRTAGHEGQGGMGARLNRHGKWIRSIGENLAWATSNADETIMVLMIDDGIKNRGHRINILNPSYKKVGVAIDDHPKFSKSWVIKYAEDFEEKDNP